MRIAQANVNLKFFRETFLKQFGFVQYYDANAPALFYGCFHSIYNRIKLHKGFAVIVWCGSDSMQLIKNNEFSRYLQRRKDIFHIAETKFISDDLTKCGIKHELYPFNIINIDHSVAKPLGKNVYVYSSHNDPEFYGASIVARIRKRMPEINFVVRYANPPDFASPDELKQIYEDSFIGLRLVPHDGFSCTVAELGLMGRKVVWNSNAPNAIPWTTDDDIMAAIRGEYARAGETDTDLSLKMAEFLKISEEVFDTDHYLKDNSKNYIKPKQSVMKKVSIVINSLNNDPEILRAAIRSYLAQQGVEVQIIVSTVEGDSAIEIAKELGCILVVSKKASIYGQLNAGIKEVTGDYFCFASGNDVALPGKLKLESDILKEKQKSVCYSAFQVLQNGNVKNRMFHDYSFEKHLQGNFVSDCSMMTKEILDKYAPFDMKHKNMAFYDFWLRVSEGEGGKAFVYNPVPTWRYCISENSAHIARQKDPKAVEQNEALRSKMLAYHNQV